MLRHCRFLIGWAAMTITMIDGPVSAAPSDNTLPPDLQPMLAHAAIVAEMMHACGHTRTDLAARLSDAWSAWWVRNGKVQQTLAELKKRATEVESEERTPEISQLHISPAEAGEILAAYKRLRRLLRRQVEEQAQHGNMKFAGNCDDVLAKLTSGRLDYRPREN